MEHEQIYLGYDPGGIGAGGCAILRFGNDKEPPVVRLNTVDSVDEAIAWFDKRLEGNIPSAAGIDAFIYWETGRSGWRAADEFLKVRYEDDVKSVLSSNSTFGSMAVQGMAMAMRLKSRWPKIQQITEAHPKVLFRALTNKKHDGDEKNKEDCCIELKKWTTNNVKVDLRKKFSRMANNDHEYDAILAAWAAMNGHREQWVTNLRDFSVNALEPAGEVYYWWPPWSAKHLYKK